MKQWLKDWSSLLSAVAIIAALYGVPQCSDIVTKAWADDKHTEIEADIQSVQGNIGKVEIKLDKVDEKVDKQGNRTVEKLEAMRLELKQDMKDHMRNLGRMLQRRP